MTNIVSLDINGETFNIDGDKLFSINREAQRVLAEIEALQSEFKDIIEEGAEELGIKKSKLGKYAKERFKVKTKETKATGELSGELDNLLEKK